LSYFRAIFAVNSGLHIARHQAASVMKKASQPDSGLLAFSFALTADQ
jgi:hypothetical protein